MTTRIVSSRPETEVGETTRDRILAAARELLGAEDGWARFTVEAVARQAGVARMTVYYQFRSKAGVVGAVIDSMASDAGVEQLRNAFPRPKPMDALAAFVAIFCRFWSTDRLVLRRLHALAALDPELAATLRSRDDDRETGLRMIAERQLGTEPDAKALGEMTDLLMVLTSFHTFEMLTERGHNPQEIAAMVTEMGRTALTERMPAGRRPPSPN